MPRSKAITVSKGNCSNAEKALCFALESRGNGPMRGTTIEGVPATSEPYAVTRTEASRWPGIIAKGRDSGNYAAGCHVLIHHVGPV